MSNLLAQILADRGRRTPGRPASLFPADRGEPQGNALREMAPGLYGALGGLAGTAPDQFEGSVLDPLTARVRAGAEMGFPVGTAAQVLPLVGGLLKRASALPGAMNKQRGAITASTAPQLRAMSKEEFLGSPRIVGKGDAKDLRPLQINSLADAEVLPFMGGKYQAKYSPNGAVVLDGDKPIASYNFGDTLVVDPKYRKRGIGEELVYQQRTFFPEPAQASTRNKISQAIQEKVYQRIQRDLEQPQLGAINVGMKKSLPYQIEHKPMSDVGGAARLHDLTPSFGEDIYGKNALQFFGSGDKREAEVLRVLGGVRGKPDAKVTIYRGVPKDANGINPGDWVTLSEAAAKDYAAQHAGGKVVKMQVPAAHITSWADSLLEFGYFPK